MLSAIKGQSTKQLQPAIHLQLRSLTPPRTERRDAIITQRGSNLKCAHAEAHYLELKYYNYSPDSSEVSSALATRFPPRFAEKYTGRVSSQVECRVNSKTRECVILECNAPRTSR